MSLTIRTIRACSFALLFAFLPINWAKAQVIATGSDQKAHEYYARISADLRFDTKIGVTTLDGLLEFAGYPVSGKKLEALDPAVLMDPVRASSPDEGLGLQTRGLAGATLRNGDILATRFFAPKIANVNVASPIPGWRKLVRLRARPDSNAARVGIESVIILFNFFASNDQPFATSTVNTQVMLLAPSRKDRLYWMDFDPNGNLGSKLNASFDAADLPKGASGTTLDYFVPDGCNDCHGSASNFLPPMVNYLDTDHWFDSLDDDFASLKAAGTALVFDAHTNDASQPSFSSAFDVIRRFNEETLLQNSEVQPHSFEAQAARTWLNIHAKSDEHFPPIARGFSRSEGSLWQPSEADGLGKLNRYCFRCHGSVRFSVFERDSVVERAGNIRQRIDPSEQQKKHYFKMPPDRDLGAPEVQALDNFIKNLK